MTRKAMQTLANRITAYFNAPPISVAVVPGCGGEYFVDLQFIAVGAGRARMHRGLMLHELAHHILYITNSAVAMNRAHGPEFCAMLERACAYCYGKDWRKKYNTAEYAEVCSALKLPDKIPPYACDCGKVLTSRGRLSEHLSSTGHGVRMKIDTGGNDALAALVRLVIRMR